ncbi:MAG: LytTR family DNA-binding domain-containing protein [Verrucomicrobiota bacterium]
MPESITCYLVDDEPLARLRMEQLLSGFPDIEIKGQYGNGTACIEATLAESPDLIFLDIGLPDHNGLEVVSELAAEMEALPAIVFATAFNEHAITAFELNALDYLLKPITLERLTTTIERVRQVIRTNASGEEDQKLRQWMTEQAKEQSHDFLNKIEIKERGSTSFIPIESIYLFQADGNYIEVHTAERASLLRMTMAKLEKLLNPDHFVRVSRSAIVPIKRVASIDKKGRHDSWVSLDTGERIGASRNLDKLEERVREL